MPMRRTDTNQAHQKNNKIGHCPFCHGIILRDSSFEEKSHLLSFKMRCPHCQKDVLLKIKDGSILINDLDVR